METRAVTDQNENIRRLTPNDISGVLYVQQLAYIPALLEKKETFQNKQTLFPEGVFGYFLNEALEAYIFSHPWTSNEPAPLDRNIFLPRYPDCIYIHDLAISPACRRRGVANKLLGEAFRTGDRLALQKYALTAVQSSEPFWTHIGFKPIKTMDYGGTAASYMVFERSRSPAP